MNENGLAFGKLADFQERVAGGQEGDRQRRSFHKS